MRCVLPSKEIIFVFLICRSIQFNSWCPFLCSVLILRLTKRTKQSSSAWKSDMQNPVYHQERGKKNIHCGKWHHMAPFVLSSLSGFTGWTGRTIMLMDVNLLLLSVLLPAPCQCTTNSVARGQCLMQMTTLSIWMACLNCYWQEKQKQKEKNSQQKYS